MKKLILIFSYIVLSPHLAISGITEMVPCSMLYELTPEVVKIHHDVLRREFRDKTKQYIKNPVLIMYESPAFDPESILVLYKESTSYKLELLQFDKSLWGQVYQQIDESGNKIHSFNQIKVSYKISRNSKIIDDETVAIIKKVSDLMFGNARRPTEKESKSTKHGLDGSIFTFEYRNEPCAMISGSYEGNANEFLGIGLLLRQYIESDINSQPGIKHKILKASNHLINSNL